MKKILIAALVLSALASPALSSGNPAKERQLIMKNVGAAMGAAVKMVKGQVEFDAVAAQLAIKTMNQAALSFGYMFPEGSEAGESTEASPAIWSDREGFDKALAKFTADTTASFTDLEGFKAAFGAAASNCGACHKAFRVKK